MTCSQAAPCKIDIALSQVAVMSGDTVHLSADTFDIGFGVTVSSGVTLSGAGANDTTLHMTGTASADTDGLKVMAAGHVDNLTAFSDVLPDGGSYAAALTLGPGATAAKVIAVNHPTQAMLTGNTPACAGSSDLQMSNSVCFTTQDAAMDLQGQTSGTGGVLNSVTAVSLQGNGLVTTSGTGSSLVINESIINGGGEAPDIDSQLTTLTINSSNFTPDMGAPTCGDALCTTDRPVFADLANGDLHQTADSASTIDKGGNDTPGTDLDGNTRKIGPKADMGAYELPLSPAASADVTDITETTAHFSATVNGGGANGATYQVKSGATTLDGGDLPIDAGNVTISKDLTGLTENTQYTLRVIVASSRGTKDLPVTFTTRAKPVVDPPKQGPPKKVIVPASWDPNAVADTFKVRLKLKSRKIDADSKGRFTLTLVSQTAKTLSGSLSAWKPVGDDDDFTLRANASKKIRLKLSHTSLKALRKDKDGKVAATAVATVTAGDGARKQVFLDFVLTR